MRISIIGRGSVGGGLAALWSKAGHRVTTFGREGGNVADAEVVVVAVPSDGIADALGSIDGLGGQITIDATNALTGGDQVTGRFESLAHRVKSIIGGPTAKAFNVNFAALYDEVPAQRMPPSVMFAADGEAEAVTVRLIEDAGFTPLKVGDLRWAGRLEEQARIMFAIYEAGMGPFFYRYAPPGQL